MLPIFKQNLNRSCNQDRQIIVLDRAHISSNSSFSKFENFQFKLIPSLGKIDFFECKLEFRDEFAEFFIEHFEYLFQVLFSLSLSKLQTNEQKH